MSTLLISLSEVCYNVTEGNIIRYYIKVINNEREINCEQRKAIHGVNSSTKHS